MWLLNKCNRNTARIIAVPLEGSIEILFPPQYLTRIKIINQFKANGFYWAH